MSNKEVWVVGHKNPDSDSICSVLAYSKFKNTLDGDKAAYIPKRLGGLSEETKFIIDYFGVDAPELVEDARPQLSDVEFHHPAGLTSDMTVRQAWDIMHEEEIETLPVLDGDSVKGLVTIGDLSRAIFAVEDPAANADMILAAFDQPVENVYTSKDKLMTFLLTDFVDDIKLSIADTRYRYFPVEDQNGKYAGLVSKGDLVNVGRKQVILIDHQEKTQAIDGIDTAEILEIIDHHRLGGLSTAGPLFARLQPVGCSSTIIYQMFKEAGLVPDKSTAGLMMSAIISDTLLFRSPTCTPADKEAGLELAKIAGVDAESYAREMFKAGSNLGDKTAEEIFFMDFKRFEIGGKMVGVGQVSTINSDEIDDLHRKISDVMDSVIEDKGLDNAFLMITDIMEESSKVVCGGSNGTGIMEKAFNVESTGDSVFLPGVVSRKKQMIPALMGAM